MKTKNQIIYQNSSCIYLIKNKINNKVYIGRTNNSSKRFSKHKALLFKNKHPNKHLQNAWNKYGSYNFEFIIDTYADIPKLPYLEEKILKSYKKNMIYNIMDINNNIHKHSKETKLTLSLATSRNRIGYITPDSTKEKIRNTLRKINSDNRKKIKKLYNTNKYSQRQLAQQFNVNQRTIWRIVHEK
jgi:group I intron endonuclease